MHRKIRSIAQTQILLLETKVTQLTDKNDILTTKCGMLELKKTHTTDNERRIIELENELDTESKTKETLRDKCNMLEHRLKSITDMHNSYSTPTDTWSQEQHPPRKVVDSDHLLSDAYQKMLEHQTKVTLAAKLSKHKNDRKFKKYKKSKKSKKDIALKMVHNI